MKKITSKRKLKKHLKKLEAQPWKFYNIYMRTPGSPKITQRQWENNPYTQLYLEAYPKVLHLKTRTPKGMGNRLLLNTMKHIPFMKQHTDFKRLWRNDK